MTDTEQHTPKWDGITKAKSLNDWARDNRQALADAAKAYNWDEVIRLVTEEPDFINSTRLDSDSYFTPLHQAAHGGASREVIEQLIDVGAWRTLRNGRGDRPVDIARERGHKQLLDLLEPVYVTRVPEEMLTQIQRYFHVVIRGRANELVNEHELRLPELEPLLEIERDTRVWFSIPGMYGGFNYWLAEEGERAKLLCESWCRVAGGSGQRHEITFNSCNLVDEGFV